MSRPGGPGGAGGPGGPGGHGGPGGFRGGPGGFHAGPGMPPPPPHRGHRRGMGGCCMPGCLMYVLGAGGVVALLVAGIAYLF